MENNIFKNVFGFVGLLIICLALCLTSCVDTSNCYSKNEKTLMVISHDFVKSYNVSLIDIEFDGETHEYVYYISNNRGSLSHWASCKYCKGLK